MQLDGDEADPATEVTDYASIISPAWSPDGTEIVYALGDQGNWDLFRTPAMALGQPTPVTQHAALDIAPDWQPKVTPATVPTCSIGTARAIKGTGTTAQMSFPVNCENPTANTYLLDYASSDRTAFEPHDYTLATGSIQVPPGTSHPAITVSLNSDTAPEPHETFSMTITSPDITTPTRTATATILDDDAFSVSAEPLTGSVVEGDSGFTDVPVRLRLSHPADQFVRVTVNSRSLTTIRPSLLVLVPAR